MDIDSKAHTLSHEKKGMSPLIATVLLIAFAVALGAMVINIPWNPDAGPDCSKIIMIINPYLCYANNMINMSIRNTGAPVEEVTVRVVDESADYPIKLMNSAFKRGEIFKRELSFTKTSKTYVGFIPSVKYKEEVVPCPEPVLEMPDLPDC
ncbi:hypothetical protein KY348_02365 [Candidatus Woesearchaeota archaeon]|nr:hypothetical protein [Candidatus Woesearchaeota archaeon]